MDRPATHINKSSYLWTSISIITYLDIFFQCFKCLWCCIKGLSDSKGTVIYSQITICTSFSGLLKNKTKKTSLFIMARCFISLFVVFWIYKEKLVICWFNMCMNSEVHQWNNPLRSWLIFWRRSLYLCVLVMVTCGL